MKTLKVVTALALAGSVTLVHAATSTGQLSVDATVAASCSVANTTLTFGSVDPLVLASTDADAQADISVTCSNTTSYNVGLDAGLTTGATVTTRQMDISGTGTDKLNYSLYSDSARSVNWGNTVGTDTVVGTGSGSAIAHTVYGRIPSGQNNAPVGTYNDTVTITVTY